VGICKNSLGRDVHSHERLLVTVVVIINSYYIITMFSPAVMTFPVGLQTQFIGFSLAYEPTTRMSSDYADVMKKGPVKIKGKRLGVNFLLSYGDLLIFDESSTAHLQCLRIMAEKEVLCHMSWFSFATEHCVCVCLLV